MNSTILQKAKQAVFINFFHVLQYLSKLVFCTLLALILSMTEIILSSIPITIHGVAEAVSINKNKYLSSFQVGKTLAVLEKARNFIATGSSFIPDISILRATLTPTIVPTFAPTIAPTFAPTIAPTLSLIGRVDFFFEVQEVNLIKINIGTEKNSFASPALEFYKLGVEKAQQKADYKGAVKDYSDALRKDGKFAEAYVSRGRAYSELGDQERAIADYTMAMNVSPKFAEDEDRYVEPLLGRGTVHIKLGNYKEALNDFNLAIQRNPDFYDAYLARAIIYIEQKDYQQAINDLTEALKLTADNYPAAFLKRGSVWAELGEYEKAIEDFTQTIDNHADDANTYYPDAYYKRGLINLNFGEPEKAMKDFNNAINLDSKYYEAYYKRAIAHEKIGEYEAANQDYINAAYSKGLLTYNLTGHSGMFAAVRSVAISPDGIILASGSEDSTIKLWNLKTGQEIKTLSGN